MPGTSAKINSRYANEVEIISTKYCVKSERQILWLTCTKGFAKKLFVKAAQVQDRTLRLTQYIPHAALNRKIRLEEALKEYRSKVAGMRTQVRLGVNDFIVLGKIQKPNTYERYKTIELSIIDPMNKLPPIKPSNSFSETNDSQYIREATKSANQAGSMTSNRDKDPKNPEEFTVVGKRKER